MSKWKIRPINTGYVTTAPRQYIYHHSVLPAIPGIPEGRITMPVFCFLLDNGIQNVLVDTGMAWTERADKYHHAGSYQPEGMAVFEQLQKIGINPHVIDAVILTHLHWDHVYYLDRFTHATLYVNEKEYRFAMNPIPIYYKSYEHPSLGIESQFRSLSFAFTKDEEELFPGIRILDTPGHSPGHISVEVDTAEGTYICCGDSLFMRKNYDPVYSLGYDVTPPGRYSDIIEAWNSIARQKIRAAGREYLLPTHEPAIEELIKTKPVIG